MQRLLVTSNGIGTSAALYPGTASCAVSLFAVLIGYDFAGLVGYHFCGAEFIRQNALPIEIAGVTLSLQGAKSDVE